jgi:catechol 2,3-dioxygenase-like lactoylglutathione lyase family enzyme
MFRIERLDHVAFTARDIDGLAEWYTKIFGMERVYAEAWSGRGDPVALCANDACVALFRRREGAEMAAEWADPDPGRHFAMALDRANFEQAQRDLQALGIEFKLRNHKVCDSLYLNDPEGHEIELTTYEV